MYSKLSAGTYKIANNNYRAAFVVMKTVINGSLFVQKGVKHSLYRVKAGQGQILFVVNMYLILQSIIVFDY